MRDLALMVEPVVRSSWKCWADEQAVKALEDLAAAERAGQTAALRRLQQHGHDQEQANEHMKYRKQCFNHNSLI